jgi:hypothetical protein
MANMQVWRNEQHRRKVDRLRAVLDDRRYDTNEWARAIAHSLSRGCVVERDLVVGFNKAFDKEMSARRAYTDARDQSA